ncbi:MAG: ferredoxin [Myxococcota bacterium]
MDLDLCQGHGVCTGEAPAVFDIDREESKVVLRMESPDPEQREAVELAVRHCPTRALSIEE